MDSPKTPVVSQAGFSDGSSVLSAEQRVVADRVLQEEGARREHLVVALSGAHAYGFPSPDSDLDLKAVHIDPTRRLLGLGPPPEAANRLELVDGVEIDYTSNEVGTVLAGVLLGNGNYLERLLGPIILSSAPELEELRELTRRSLSRRLHRHYRGFALSQLGAVTGRDEVPAKRVLYVLRTALTGTHALLEAEVVPDVTLLLERYGFTDAGSLLEAKRRGEKAPLPRIEVERWRTRLKAAIVGLDEAVSRSPLPEVSPGFEALDAWLVELRRRRL